MVGDRACVAAEEAAFDRFMTTPAFQALLHGALSDAPSVYELNIHNPASGALHAQSQSQSAQVYKNS